jgi:GMP synthase-like glutamine amidotransferase
MAATENAVLIVDNSEGRRAGSWFEYCMKGCAEVRIAMREDVKTLGKRWKAVILTGSERSVFEDADWLVEQLAFTRSVMDEGVPLLGVCFGHQLLFRALYGKDILRRRELPEVGWVPVELAAHPVFEGVGSIIRPYNFHFDEVVEIPPGWEAVASSEACRLHGLRRVELPVLGLQFHPEVSPREGVAAIGRGARLLAAYDLDAAAITAGSDRGGHYPEIIRNFVSLYGR